MYYAFIILIFFSTILSTRNKAFQSNPTYFLIYPGRLRNGNVAITTTRALYGVKMALFANILDLLVHILNAFLVIKEDFFVTQVLLLLHFMQY